MQVVKRVVVLIAELVAEAVLLGCWLGILVAGRIGLLYGVAASTLVVPVLLFIHWYYLTRVLAGLALRIKMRWVYPVTAGALFVGHTGATLAGATGDLSQFAQAIELPFLAGGGFIVFICALLGDRLLRKWTQTRIRMADSKHGRVVPT